MHLTVAIATRNSAHIVGPTLESIQSQVLPSGVSVQTMVVDGESEDATLRICRDFGAISVANPNRDPMSAKLRALDLASGTHIMFLDHDERLLSPTGIEQCFRLFESHSQLRIVWQTGYHVSTIGEAPNLFASEFGDAYSKFIYGNSAMEDQRISNMIERFTDHQKTDLGVLFLPRDLQKPILLEVAAAGTVVDLKFIRGLCNRYGPRALLSPLRFMSDELIAVALNSPVGHDSAPTWSAVRTKTRWRVTNAVNPHSPLHEVSGRHGHTISDKSLLLRNILFVVYSLSIVPVIIDYLILSIRRRRSLFGAVHLPIFTVLEIAWQIARRRLLDRIYTKDYAGN